VAAAVGIAAVAIVLGWVIIRSRFTGGERD
jgi:hypothetical protein